MVEQVYSRSQVDEWRNNLERIANEPRTSFTKRQAVEELIDTIEVALVTRSYAEVAASLVSWGLDISEGSLKQYVTRFRKANKPKAAAPSKKRSGRSSKSVGAVSSSAGSAEKRSQSSISDTKVNAAGERSQSSVSDSKVNSAGERLQSSVSDIKVNAVSEPVTAAGKPHTQRKPRNFLEMPDEL